jgi:hypothetical protein
VVILAALAWLSVAAAQEEFAEEVIVYGELQVIEARRDVDAALRMGGFTLIVEKDGKTIYRHENPYGGEVVIHEEEGFMRVKRQPVRFEGREMPWARRNSALAWAGCVIWLPLCVRPGGQVQAHRRHMAAETRAARLAQPGVNDWSARIADLAVDRKSALLPDKLKALWEHGTPLDDPEASPLLSGEARRRALFDFWASRTDTVWGEEIRATVESFLRAVVQSSDYPITAEELAAWNASSSAGRALELPGLR